jgi:antitoxin FitA
MGDLLIRNIPDALKADLTKRAELNGRSLSEEAKARLRKSLLDDADTTVRPKRNAYDALRSIFVEEDALLSDEEHAEFMRAIEEGRRDTGRPVPDFE